MMRSVSGLRGIVGAELTADVVRRYAAAFGAFLRGTGGRVAGLARDSRQSGPAFAAAAAEALAGAGLDVVDFGMVSTPTAQLAALKLGLAGGIVVTASHNPIAWNALKFIGPGGRFLTRGESREFYALVDRDAATAAPRAGRISQDRGAAQRHLDLILGLPWLDVAAVRARRLTVALDCVRGAGATIMPSLLERMGCEVAPINLEPDGRESRASPATRPPVPRRNAPNAAA